MSVSLNNKRILVTRPEHQAGHLCDLISANNGRAIPFPTIDIQAVSGLDNSLIHSEILSKYNFIIFVSRNAVKVAFEQYTSLINCFDQIQFIAIGAGTADALAELNVVNVLHAGLQAESEALLQLPEMQSASLAGQTVLIIRGVGGREHLREVLISRGASVDYAEVYKRCLPNYEVKDTHKIWQDIKPDAIIVSSNNGLKNLVDLTSEIDRGQLFNTPLVLMSNRSINLAKELGFASKINTAVDKNDQGLLLALLGLVGE